MKYKDYAWFAYTAGVVDSDGCISIGRRYSKKGANPDYALQLRVKQKDGRIIDFLNGFWKQGSVSYEPNRDVYCWRANGNEVMEVLRKIEPFLRYKRNQARKAIEFQRYKNRANKARMEGGGTNPYHGHVVEKFDEYYLILRGMKKDYAPSNHLQRLSELASLNPGEEATV